MVHALGVGLSRPLANGRLEDMAAHHKRDVLADEVAKVDQRRPSAGQAAQDEDLRSVVFHVLFDVNELLHTLERLFVGLRLSGRAPIDLGISIDDEEVEEAEEGERDQGRRPIHEEHDEEAEQGSGKAHPTVVVLEGGPPTDRLDERRVKRGEIDQTVGAEEKVGNERCDGVQLGCFKKKNKIE